MRGEDMLKIHSFVSLKMFNIVYRNRSREYFMLENIANVKTFHCFFYMYQHVNKETVY